MPVNKKFTSSIFPSGGEKIKNKIIELLSFGPEESTNLVDKVRKETLSTKQGVYKGVRELLVGEQILKHKSKLSLNLAWIKKLKDFAEKIETSYIPKSSHLLQIPENKKSLSLSFNSTEELDIYWGHMFLLIIEKLKDEQIFFFNRHEWFIYDRPHSENHLLEVVKKENKRLFTTLGANTVFAKEFKTKYQNENIQVAIDENINIPITDYMLITGDYVISTRYDEVFSKNIDKFFRTKTVFGEEEEKEFREIIKQNKKSKIIITQNKEKANEWRKRLSKNFVI